jgi:hypothetical protein
VLRRPIERTVRAGQVVVRPVHARSANRQSNFRNATGNRDAGRRWDKTPKSLRSPLHSAAMHYLGFSFRFASSCTDFVVALLLMDLVASPHAAGGFVICLANTR